MFGQQFTTQQAWLLATVHLHEHLRWQPDFARQHPMRGRLSVEYWMRRTLDSIPSIRAPSETRNRQRSCTCGSQAALPITVVPGVSAAAISAFSVAMTDGSSMNTSPARRPPLGAVMTMSRPGS